MGRSVSADGPGGGIDLAAEDPHRLLLGLLRLQSMVLANPEPLAGLRTMVDEISTSPGVTRVSVGVPLGDTGRIRYLAQVGGPFARHEQAEIEATPIAAKAMATRELVQVIHTEDVPHTCIHAPILGREAVLGFFGIGILGIGPMPAWRSEAIWTTADLMALLVLERERTAAAGPFGMLDELTPRQQEVLFELVEGGQTNGAIAEQLELSEPTVKIHLLAAYRKLGVRSRTAAIRAVLTEHAAWLARWRMLKRRGTDGG